MKDAVSVAFFVTIAIVIIAYIVGSQVRLKSQLRHSYQRLAQRFQGRCHNIGLWDRPSVDFVHKNAHVLVEIFSTGGKHAKYYTQLRISWPDSRFRCEVYPEGVLSRVGKFLGMGDVEIGSPRFDADYVIAGSDVRELQEFLTPPVQHCINELRAFGREYQSFRGYDDRYHSRQGDIYFAVNGGQMQIKKLGYLRDYGQLERFVLLSLALYDQSLVTSAKGIEFVETKPTATLSLAEAICQICGEMVKLDAVFCRTCKTPHHKDCWEYYGACSTYGCGQRRFLVQRKQ
ncbi:MAG: hypothetical protein H8E66_05295 [Planctomycetes bacterium]|nr:hypothetical protein [Planctomycetota bacterium]